MNGLGSGSARWGVSAARPGLLAAPSIRLAQALCLVLVLWWVFGPLGGVALRPKALESGGNDTSPVFNWHPLLMVLAFPLLMGEAVLAYRAPAASLDDRSAKKAYHVTLQLLAWTLAVLGLTAAVRSHTLKLPAPIPNFYSPHSFLGILVFVLLFTQVCGWAGVCVGAGEQGMCSLGGEAGREGQASFCADADGGQSLPVLAAVRARAPARRPRRPDVPASSPLHLLLRPPSSSPAT